MILSSSRGREERIGRQTSGKHRNRKRIPVLNGLREVTSVLISGCLFYNTYDGGVTDDICLGISRLALSTAALLHRDKKWRFRLYLDRFTKWRNTNTCGVPYHLCVKINTKLIFITYKKKSARVLLDYATRENLLVKNIHDKCHPARLWHSLGGAERETSIRKPTLSMDSEIFYGRADFISKLLF